MRDVSFPGNFGLLSEFLKKQPPPPKPEVYELAFIGAGSTTAYYIDTLGPMHDFSTTLLFGDTKNNPWAGQRGDSIDFINHTRRQIEMPSRNVTDYPGEARTTEMFMKRAVFANTAAETIARAIPEENCIKAAIDKNGISKPKGMDHYEIKTDKGTYKVKRVVFAAGAGGHKEPGFKDKLEVGKAYEVDVDPSLRGKGKQVIDMDEFIRDVVHLKKGKVIVMGGNAAIDAVAAAKLYDWDVIWFASGPAYLPGTFYMDRPYEIQKVPRFDAVHVDVVAESTKLERSYWCRPRELTTGQPCAPNRRPKNHDRRRGLPGLWCRRRQNGRGLSIR